VQQCLVFVDEDTLVKAVTLNKKYPAESFVKVFFDSMPAKHCSARESLSVPQNA
jgi:hypothetical protein